MKPPVRGQVRRQLFFRLMDKGKRRPEKRTQVQQEKEKSGEFQSGDAIWLAGCGIQRKEEAHSFTNSELPNSLPAETSPPLPPPTPASSSYRATPSQVASVWLP